MTDVRHGHLFSVMAWHSPLLVMTRLDRVITLNIVLMPMARSSRISIPLSGSGGGVFLPSSSSGLARGSLHAHSAPIRATCRVAADARVKPEHDDRGNAQSHPDRNLMHMRPSRAMTWRRRRHTAGIAKLARSRLVQAYRRTMLVRAVRTSRTMTGMTGHTKASQ